MKKTLLSFLCIGSACLMMAQTTRPSPDPTTPTMQQAASSSMLNDTTPKRKNYPSDTTRRTDTLKRDTTPNSSMYNNMNEPNMNMNPVDSNRTGSLGRTSANPAYNVSVPTSIQATFTTAYPTAGNSVVWQQSGDWYRARYMENGKLMESSYREDGKSFTRQASPVMRTYVPEEIANRAMQQYGMNVYAIAASKGADGQNVYNVTIIDNGQSRTEWMNEDGSPLTSPYRTDMDQQQQQQSDSNMRSPNGQATPLQGTVVQTGATPATNSSAPATNDEHMNSPERQPQTLEQGNGIPEVTPDSSTGNSGINNGTSSDSLLRERRDQSSMKPEE